jgi:phytoene desaturase
MTRDVVVIGAGLGGLSAACHLAGAGYDVTVVERGASPGGRAGSLQLGDYRFDTGPTVLTMPSIFERCFDAVGVDMRQLLALRPLEPMYRACFGDGSELRVRHGRDAMAHEIESLCGSREAGAFHRFADWLTALHACEMPNFIDRNYDSPLDLVRPLPPAIALLRLGGFRRLSSAVGRFFDDDRLRRLFSFQSLYAGLAPHQALAVYAVITYMDTIDGVVTATGGVHALPSALAAAAEIGGAKFRYDTPVDRILAARPDGGPVRGVRLESGEFLPADIVVCNADLPGAYERLLPGLSPPSVLRRGHFSPSAVVWYVGVRGELPAGAARHNIHFAQPWRSAFRSLLDDGRRMPHPSLLISAQSLGEPTHAPENCHALYMLEPVPNLSGSVDWATERARVRDDMAGALQRFGYPTDIEVEALVDPTDWASQGLAHGTPFGLSHRFLQSGPFRPSNVERRMPGLYFTGTSTVPGIGVPMVILSGELAARRVAARGTHEL